MYSQPTYDNSGRMKYHPEYHPNQGKPWTVVDQNYLIEFYGGLGPEQISFDLGRTIATVMDRACVLRKRGLMAKLKTRVNHRRMKPY